MATKSFTNTNAMYAQKAPFKIDVVLIIALLICSSMGHVFVLNVAPRVRRNYQSIAQHHHTPPIIHTQVLF